MIERERERDREREPEYQDRRQSLYIRHFVFCFFGGGGLGGG